MLVADHPDSHFRAEQVYRSQFPGSNGLDTVLLFRNEELAAAFVNELVSRGTNVGAARLASADELTDLLSRLKDLGVSHVVFDPPGARIVRRPIDSIIIGLQLSE